MTMSRSDTGPNQSGLNGSGTDAEILDSSLTVADGHIPAPAGHAPRLDVEQVDPDSNAIRVSERECDEAWIEYTPTEVV